MFGIGTLTHRNRKNSPSPALPRFGEGSSSSLVLKGNQSEVHRSEIKLLSYESELPSPVGEGLRER